MPDVIDLRSDTVTRPVPAMREAMATAVVGDDVIGDDPTVKALEAAAAAAVGKESALFVPSGTMANLVSLLTHCGRGDEAVVGSESHILHHEGLGAPALGGVSLRSVHNDARGHIDATEVEMAIRRGSPRTTVVCLENTQNRCGGATIPASEMRQIAEVAHASGASVHVDGARIFNAAAALETDAKTLLADADTVSFCFSKGLGAPVGSVLTGSNDFIQRAHPIRRQVGGGMRQSGILAAAALYALEHHVERLTEDQANAKRLAQGLAAIPGIVVDHGTVDTNMVFLRFDGIDGPAFQMALAERGVLTSTPVPSALRMVTHMDVSAADIEAAIVQAAAAAKSVASE
jgi:threonine aldolase